MDKKSRPYTAFTLGNLGFFKCNCMPFRLCNAPYVPKANAELPRRAKPCLLCHLPRWHHFLWMAEEHSLHLWAIINWFREYNLKLKPSKCDFFRKEITYLAHQVLKEGVLPSNSNLKAIAEYASPRTYTEMQAFLGMVGHYQRFIKVFTQIT